ncbi:hypothetical protein [Methanogenium cariaci]|uniref:hypothetical protein n=1 Tax=Methanogenium cariaci TaxID=2197 RepID=UPI000783AE40|nr:hypothetical protein [Methanogenium cariaci]
MRYFLRDQALFIRGAFTAITPGTRDTAKDSSITRISTIIATHLPQTNTPEDTYFVIGNLLRKHGYAPDAVSLPSSIPIDRLRIFAFDGIMVFILAGLAEPGGRPPDPVTIMVCCREPPLPPNQISGHFWGGPLKRQYTGHSSQAVTLPPRTWNKFGSHLLRRNGRITRCS